MAPNWEPTLVVGEVLKFTLNFEGDNGPFNLTGCTFQIEPPQIPISIQVSNASQGVTVLTIDSTGAQPGSYPYEIFMTLPNGERWLVLSGYLKILSGPVR